VDDSASQVLQDEGQTSEAGSSIELDDIQFEAPELIPNQQEPEASEETNNELVSDPSEPDNKVT
jgi:hypothetical protein